ncbi:hypothetical protein SLEP1_g11060 [Rubroshorea leprosula]|uniref:H15 domain-containing protein n=1 Tax=Rubroshorea leprosula TaxID=152421 RepID=A0AAV5IA29_9ROSI|nr:hypothetical protein SLEP1_g11060 [Rubroshorea leprosula]
MATENPANTQSLPPQQQSARPDYNQLIMAAIEALNEPSGSSKSAISKHIESTLTDLPSEHLFLIPIHLDELKKSGQLLLVKNNYMKPGPNAPPKRGRGRPPKPKEPLPPGTVLPPPRPRGRPPKARDPFAPPPKPKTSAGTGRPRGRPPKKVKSASAAASAPPPVSGVKRGRGRPPKVKPAVTPVGC